MLFFRKFQPVLPLKNVKIDDRFLTNIFLSTSEKCAMFLPA